VRNCHWDTSAASFCSGDLPSSPPQVCALSLTVTCGGTPGDPSVNCWNCDNITPGASDYDPGTDCTSQWGTSVGMAPACADAIAQVQ